MNRIKSFIITIICVTVYSSIVAQPLNFDEWKTKGFKSPRQDMLIFELTHERITNQPNGFKHGVFSRGVNVQLMYDFIIKKSNFSVGIGAGFSSQSLINNSTLLRDDSLAASYFVPFPDSDNYRKNKMVTSFGEIPIEIRYRTKANSKDHSWKYALGARFGTLLDVHSKFVDGTGKYKNYIFPDVEPLRIGVYGRVGYGRASLSFYRAFTPYLTNSLQGNMNSYAIGLHIAIF